MTPTRKVIIICVFASAVLFANSDTGEAGEESTTDTNFSEALRIYRDRRDIQRAVEDSSSNATCNTEDLPRTYLAYHLNGQDITIDGHLDDPAWGEVPWTDDFMDIRGPDYQKPRFNTKVKVRWNDERVYIGARMEETDFWGNITEDESRVFEENAFEVFIVPDGSFHNYKEMEINVLNTTWDLAMNAAYMDFVGNGSAFNESWESGQEKATYTDGSVNNPNRTGTFWTAEWSFSFENLAEHTTRSNPEPAEDEVWFFNFARPEHHFKITDGEYEKDDDKPTYWWSWQPMYAVNLHIPSRFGLVQFKRDMNETHFNFDKWHTYRALLEIFHAEHKYKALNGMFSDDLQSLDMAPKILSHDCVNNITITVGHSGTTFEAVVTSSLDPGLPTGHIKQDRYVWFT